MFSKKIKYLLILTYFLISTISFSENFISNGGFEGPDGIEIIPSDWSAGCGVMNTPDTQPGWWNVENKPFEGESYIDLLYKEDGTTESIYQKLETPLPQGSCFLIEIYLAQACQDSLSGLYHFGLNNPGDLIIRGSDVYGCDNGQILATFEQVSNCEWKVHYAVFQAEFEINYIYLEFDKGISPSKDGSILIDNFILDFTDPFPTVNQSFLYGTEAILIPSLVGSNYNWTIDGISYEDDSSFQILEVTDNMTIDLNYLSTDSCLIFESWQIYVDPIIPNVFTPLSSDNINDTFFITGLKEKSYLTVLNRWGQLIYENKNYQNDWSPLSISPGTYFYTLYLSESHRFYSGFITIL